MKNQKLIFLPGLQKQYQFLTERISPPINAPLVIGSASEGVALRISEFYSCPVNLIVEDYESILNAGLLLGGREEVKLSLMSFEATDFKASQFDLIYAQASVSLVSRNKIIKEIKRILKPGGYFCVGEIVSFRKELPPFVKNIFDSSNLLPLPADGLKKYYSERNFKILAELDLSSTLADYYSRKADKLRSIKENMSEEEQRYYKKLINKIRHESNAYLNLGSNKYFGFITLLMQKGEN